MLPLEFFKTFAAKGGELLQKSKDGFKRSLDALYKMLNIFSKGEKAITEFFESIWKKIANWFLENKKLFSLKKYDDIPDLLAKELDWMSKTRKGNLGGKVLKATQVRKLRGLLKQKGIQLIIEGDKRSVKRLFKPVDSFKTFDELIRFMKSRNPPLVGGFNATNKQFYLLKDATEIVVFHELAHLKHFESLGDAYLKLSRLKKEMYVWKQILATRNKWTEAELLEALRYINRIRVKEYGLKPINF